MQTRHKFLALAAVSLCFAAGCVPSDEDIRADVAAVRQHAYEEWKAGRERGESKEARADGPLSLDDAIRMALQYNKALQSQVQNRDIAQGQKWSDYAVVLPSAQITAGATRVEKGRGNWDPDDFSFGLRVTQPIMQGAKIPATLRKAHLNIALADEQIRGQVQDLIRDVSNNYYDVLLAQHLVETHREALVSAEAQLRMVTEKKKQETATDYDVLRAQVDVATYRSKMISEQNNVDTNRVALLKNMGISQDSEITFSDKLEFLPMRPILERAYEVASKNRPDLRQAELTAQMEHEAVRIAQSAWWPQVYGQFSQNWNDGWGNTGGQRRDSFGRNPWQAGLALSQDLGVDNYGNVRQQQGRHKQSLIDILDAQELTLMEIRQYTNSLSNAEEQVKALQVNQDAAREALRLVLVGYQAGVRTEVDVTDARKALTEVMGEYYTALSSHTKARLNLQVAMGVLGPCIVTNGAQMPPSVPIANIEEFAATDYVPPKPITIPSLKDTPSTGSRTNGARSGDAGSFRREREARDASAKPASAKRKSTQTSDKGDAAADKKVASAR